MIADILLITLLVLILSVFMLIVMCMYIDRKNVAMSQKKKSQNYDEYSPFSFVVPTLFIIRTLTNNVVSPRTINSVIQQIPKYLSMTERDKKSFETFNNSENRLYGKKPFINNGQKGSPLFGIDSYEQNKTDMWSKIREINGLYAIFRSLNINEIITHTGQKKGKNGQVILKDKTTWELNNSLNLKQFSYSDIFE